MVEPAGIEPVTSTLPLPTHRFKWRIRYWVDIPLSTLLFDFLKLTWTGLATVII